MVIALPPSRTSRCSARYLAAGLCRRNKPDRKAFGGFLVPAMGACVPELRL